MRRPASTYRLQLRPDFGFAAARDIVPYLDRLGVETLYLSPVLEALPGSTHGYDVTDPTRVRDELGGEGELRALSRVARDRGMGLVLDIVPNHMAADPRHNRWWRDVLLHGQDSEYADFFDIDWGADARIVLPVLGAPLEEVLRRGELRLEQGDDRPILRYFEHEFPVHADGLPPRAAGEFDGSDREPGSDAAAVQDVLMRQHYRLAHWRSGAAEINYRRFFDIAELVSLRVEDPAVFDATHALVRELVRDGVVTGLRVDHIDGLLDPGRYLRELQEHVFGRGPEGDRGPGTERGYVLVEKILAPGERLPAGWPVDGTTGYDFLNAVNGLMVAQDGLAAMSRIYAEFVGTRDSFDDLVFGRKMQVQEDLFAAERGRLARRLRELGTEGDVELALAAVTAALSRYRTYFSADQVRDEDRRVVADAVERARERIPGPAAAYDALEPLLTLAGAEPGRLKPEQLDLVQRWQQYSGPVMAKGFEDTALYVYNRLLSANAVGGHPARPSISVDEFHQLCRERARQPGAMNTSSTHDSKRSEDVRARIDVLTRAPEEWAATLRRWSEHSERHRLVVDGQPVPHRNLEFLAYQTLVGAWPLHAKQEAEFGERFGGYLLKASREAKTRTSWIEQNEPYEAALTAWAEAITADVAFREDVRGVLEEVAPGAADASLVQLVLKLTAPGVPDIYRGMESWDFSLVDPDNRRPVDFESLSKMLAELEGVLARPTPHAVAKLRSDWATGCLKLYLTAALLRRRRAAPGLYRDGDYLPVEIEEAPAEAVCAFERRVREEARERGEDDVQPRSGRRHGSTRLLVVAALREAGAERGRLRPDPNPGGPGERWVDVLTGRRFDGTGAGLRDLLEILPVAVLEIEGDP